jgi:cytochrome c peroxidase
MHDGSRATLADVINHYIAPPANANLDPRLARPPLNLNAQQRNDLVAFLRTLSGSAVYTDPKWSSPFNSEGQLTLIVLSTVATSLQTNGNGTANLVSTGAPGLPYRVESSTDLSRWDLVTTLNADTNGNLQHSIPTSGTSTFYRFTYIPPSI